jgi:hypothetical protein
MTTTANRFGVLAFLLAAFVIAMTVLILSHIPIKPIAVAVPNAAPNDHAMEKHGEDAIAAYNCLNGGGVIKGTFTRDADGRKATVCLEGSTYYVVIEESDGDSVSAFKKDKLKCFAQVLQYRSNRGYKVPEDLLACVVG